VDWQGITAWTPAKIRGERAGIDRFARGQELPCNGGVPTLVFQGTGDIMEPSHYEYDNKFTIFAIGGGGGKDTPTPPAKEDDDDEKEQKKDE
jgi:hypothetical protein